MTTHPDVTMPVRPQGYRLEFELLSCLSPTPVPLASLASEFGFELQSELRRALDRLEVHGVRVEYTKDGGENLVSVTLKSWKRAREIGEQYWSFVHGSVSA